MAALYFVPPRGAFVDPHTGELTRAATMFLRALFERVGGSSGDATTDIAASQFEDAGIEEGRALLFRLADDLRVTPPDVALPVEPNPAAERIAALEATVAELRRELDALRVGTTVL